MIRQQSRGDRIFSIFVGAVCTILVVLVLYPIIYVFSMSISDPHAAMAGEVVLFPVGFSLQAYRSVVNTPELWMYYYNTVWYTIVGCASAVVVTVLGAYPLSKKKLPGRNFFTAFYSFTMFFGGGLIPTYIVITRLGLFNSRLAIILPALTSAYNIIVSRTFFQSLPEEIFDSARIDGAGEWRVLGQIVLPLSKPILAVLALWAAVGRWNSYFPESLYLAKSELQPVSLYLRRVVIQSSPEAMQNISSRAIGSGIMSMMQVKYAVIVVAMLPMVFLYPFLQKYFVKGMMIGGIKG